MRTLVKGLGASGLTVLLSSHNMEEVEEICRQVTIMRTGKVVYHSTVTDLRAMAPETEFAMHTTRVARAASGPPGAAALLRGRPAARKSASRCTSRALS